MTKDPTSEFASASAVAAVGTPGSPRVPQDTAFFGHPRGLATLFFTELWERFSYYGMRALLILFMTAAVADGGLGFDAATAGAIYGLYTAGVYLAAMPGGWVADRLIGQRRAVLWGGIVIALGHFSMAIPGLMTFYLGLALIVVGTGLLKPNISTMVGELYPGDAGARRDAGFSIFYMGINLGAFIAPLVTGYLGEKIDWHLGFGAAGVGMVLGVVQYVLGGRHLGEAGLYPNAAREQGTVGSRNGLMLAGMLGGVLVLFLVMLQAFGAVDLTTAVGLASAGGIIIVTLALLYFGFMYVAGGLDAVEKKRLVVIAVLFVFSAIFWSGFEQAGSSLNLFAERLTDRVILGWEMPASFLQSVNSIFIITLAPVFAWLWVWLSRRRMEPSSPAKFSLGLIFLGLGFVVMVVASMRVASGIQVSPMWLVLTYLLHTIGELCLSPVGLSTVTKLAPHRMVGQMMGVWFMSISLGNLIAGQVAGQFETLPLPQLFGAVVATTAGAGVILALFVRPIRRLMGGVH
ncbi:MAG TPA: peptide MFS transporter [Longimicrobiaceae bacterium]|nr:peptide MFS transporter [Longimicrobiaceae bacterium]